MSYQRIVALLCMPLIAACSPTTILNWTSGAHGTRLEQDVAYGVHPRQKLDRYGRGDPTCRIIFVYGGNWREGAKEKYGFVGAQLAKSGYYTIIPNYRLYPDVSFPEFVEDIAQVVALELNEGEHQELPMVLMGHSAGALIAALLSYDNQYLSDVDVNPENIHALISLAGPHDYFLPTQKPQWVDIFGEDEQRQRNALPINHVSAKSPRTLILHGNDDNIVTPKSAQSLHEKLSQNNVASVLKTYPDIDHKKLVASIAFPLHFLAPTLDDIKEFLADYDC